jgi:hypothetical protein
VGGLAGVRDLLPWHPGLTFWMLMTAGMIWLFALSLMILRHELGTLRWSVFARREDLEPNLANWRSDGLQD